MQIPDDDDDKYERRGNHYQCIKCEEYSVHISDDKHCENPACPSNANKRRPTKSSGMPASTPSKNTSKRKLCPNCSQLLDASGRCALCTKRNAARRSGTGATAVKSAAVVPGKARTKHCPSCKKYQPNPSRIKCSQCNRTYQ